MAFLGPACRSRLVADPPPAAAGAAAAADACGCERLAGDRERLARAGLLLGLRALAAAYHKCVLGAL